MLAPPRLNLQTINHHLQQTLPPIANPLDRDPQLLHQAFLNLGRQDWLTLKLHDRRTYAQFQQAIARHSGALAFLQTQHQSAASFIANGDNDALKTDYLTPMASGESAIGVSFSHLRRRTIPVTAQPVTGGYCIDGVAPWVTGHGIFSEFILGAALPDGQMLLGLVPFATTETDTTETDTSGSICIGQTLDLVAMQSANTVTVKFDRWLIPNDKVIRLQPLDRFLASSQRNVLSHAFFPLGCTQAALDAIAQAVTESQTDRDRHDTLNAALIQLEHTFQHCEAAIYQAEFDDADTTLERKLTLRAEAIALAGRCTQAAIAVSGGRANIAGNTTERIYREALVYTVAGQTPAVMAATLNQLATDSPL